MINLELATSCLHPDFGKSWQLLDRVISLMDANNVVQKDSTLFHSDITKIPLKIVGSKTYTSQSIDEVLSHF